MTKRLQRVAPLQCGIVLACLYGAISLIAVPFIVLGVMFSKEHAGGIMVGAMLAVLIPIGYTVMGFIFGVIGAAIYNLIASWTGGLEVTFADVTPPPLNQ